MEVLRRKINLRVFNKKTSGKSSITKNLSFSITKGFVKEFKERLCERGNSVFHSPNHLSKAADGG